MYFLGEEELAKIGTKSVRRTQLELHTRLHLKYTCAITAIVNQLKSMEMLLAGCSNDEHPQAWYQCTSWVDRSWQKFVQREFVVQKLS